MNPASPLTKDWVESPVSEGLPSLSPFLRNNTGECPKLLCQSAHAHQYKYLLRLRALLQRFIGVIPRFLEVIYSLVVQWIEIPLLVHVIKSILCLPKFVLRAQTEMIRGIGSKARGVGLPHRFTSKCLSFYKVSINTL